MLILYGCKKKLLQYLAVWESSCVMMMRKNLTDDDKILLQVLLLLLLLLYYSYTDFQRPKLLHLNTTFITFISVTLIRPTLTIFSETSTTYTDDEQR